MTAVAARPLPEIDAAALRRRYFRFMAVPTAVDLLLIGTFYVIVGGWVVAPVNVALTIAFLGAANLAIGTRLFEPIRRHLAGDLDFEAVQRRLTQLPLLSATVTGAISIVLTLIRFSLPDGYPPAKGVFPEPTLVDFLTLNAVFPVFYFTLVYFLVSDYLSHLCEFIFRLSGDTLRLFFGRYALKLGIALVLVSVVPLAVITADLFSYEGARLREEILTDVLSALPGLAIVSFFVGRSLLRPVRILSRAMTEVAAGDLTVRVPVTSNDEVGEVTGRFNDMVKGLAERERIRETFGKYVDAHVAATILAGPAGGGLAGETRDATVLFTDIQGFTTIAEYVPPDQLIRALNEYLEAILEPIRKHGGTVNTFIGDGVFASFNMPFECPDHATAAVRAALDIQRAVGDRQFGDLFAFTTRVGVATGRVIGGSIGAGERLSFTLLGDTVNLAARLEQLNKDLGTRILVSDATRAACTTGFAWRDHGSILVRGRTEAVTVHSLDHLAPEPAR